jgi:hypothetical protein
MVQISGAKWAAFLEFSPVYQWVAISGRSQKVQDHVHKIPWPRYASYLRSISLDHILESCLDVQNAS